MEVVKLEDGFAIKLSEADAKQLSLTVGTILAAGTRGDDTITLRVQRTESVEETRKRRQEALADLRRLREEWAANGWLLPADYKFARDDCYPENRGGTAKD